MSSAPPPPPPPSNGTKAAGISTVVIVLGVLGFGAVCCVGPVLVALLLPAIQAAREAARRTQDQNNMRQVSMALTIYADLHGTLPPAYTVDADGKPLHSWRTLILPQLEQQGLYEQIKLDEPWDSPHNSQFHGTVLAVYKNPSDPSGPASPYANYVVVVGDQTAFPGDKPYKMSDMLSKDGGSNTILMLEVENMDIHWMEPRDLKFDEMDFNIGAPGGVGGFSGGAHAVFGDMTIRFLGNDLDPESLKGALTPEGGEAVFIP